MKIIANTGEGYLLKVTEQELANILGIYGFYGNTTPSKEDVNYAIKTEKNIEISKIYRQNENFQQLLKSEFPNAVRALKNMHDILQPIGNLIESTSRKLEKEQ